MIKKTISCALLATLCSASHALYQYNVTPTIIGSGTDGSVFIGLDINTNNCLWSGVSFAAAGNAKAIMAVALTAKASNRQVRIDFDRNATTGACNGTAVYIL
jgi:hypothetical protein